VVARPYRFANSIRTFGFNVPILVDDQLRVIVGHGRLLACQELGWTEMPTISLGHLSDAQARAFMIADNRLTKPPPGMTAFWRSSWGSFLGNCASFAHTSGDPCNINELSGWGTRIRT
jgi:hypothetical protein